MAPLDRRLAVALGCHSSAPTAAGHSYGDETLYAASLPKIAIFIHIKHTSRLLVAPVRLAP